MKLPKPVSFDWDGGSLAKPIPVFKNEDEERDFWDKVDSTEYFDIECNTEKYKARPYIFLLGLS